MQEHANADGLSHLPLNTPPGAEDPVKVGSCSRNNPQVSRVMHFNHYGWPSSVPFDLKPFYSRREELTVEGDCLLWGVRVVVSAKLRAQILSDSHRDHGGIVRMKAMTRSYMCWPGMNTDIESVAKSCVSCKAVKSAPQEASLHTWVWPAEPWNRIHVDLQDCSRAKCSFLLLTLILNGQRFSGWVRPPWRRPLSSWDAFLHFLACQINWYGIMVLNSPHMNLLTLWVLMASDTFIQHHTILPRMAQLKGSSRPLNRPWRLERERNSLSFQHRLQSFLMSYWSTPHATTGKSPASLFSRRPIRTHFDLMPLVVG